MFRTDNELLILLFYKIIEKSWIIFLVRKKNLSSNFVLKPTKCPIIYVIKCTVKDNIHLFCIHRINPPISYQSGQQSDKTAKTCLSFLPGILLLCRFIFLVILFIEDKLLFQDEFGHREKEENSQNKNAFMFWNGRQKVETTVRKVIDTVSKIRLKYWTAAV